MKYTIAFIIFYSHIALIAQNTIKVKKQDSVKVIGNGPFTSYLKKIAVLYNNGDTSYIKINTLISSNKKEKTDIFSIHINDTLDLGIRYSAYLKNDKELKPDKFMCFYYDWYYRINDSKWNYIKKTGTCAYRRDSPFRTVIDRLGNGTDLIIEKGRNQLTFYVNLFREEYYIKQ